VVGTGIPRDLLGALLVVAAAAALAPTQPRIRAGNLPLTIFRLLPVGVGLLALFWLRQLIEGEGSLWTTELAGFNALRMASFGSFVSPTSVILCFALLAYMWGSGTCDGCTFRRRASARRRRCSASSAGTTCSAGAPSSRRSISRRFGWGFRSPWR
jgi:hypothetical protein